MKIRKINATAANIQAIRRFLGVACVFSFRELKQLNAIYDFEFCNALCLIDIQRVMFIRKKTNFKNL